MTRLLVVEDDPGMARILSMSLEAHGFELEVATTASDALRSVARRCPDAIMLDLGLPDFDGIEVITELRAWTNTPILVVSARRDELQKIDALDAGANDYITKPFGMGELLARVRAALRNPVIEPREPVVRTPDFTIDLVDRSVVCQNRHVDLTPLEWGIARELVTRPGHVVTYRELLRRLWNEEGKMTRQDGRIRLVLFSLRRKLEPDPTNPRYFANVRGVGLRFDPGE